MRGLSCNVLDPIRTRYPSALAAINMDRTDTTRIGKYLLNHSFMIPGFIGVGTSTVVAYAISRAIF